MDSNNTIAAGRLVLTILVAFGLAAAWFYGLDHLVMTLQGLPLNPDLSPAG